MLRDTIHGKGSRNEHELEFGVQLLENERLLEKLRLHVPNTSNTSNTSNSRTHSNTPRVRSLTRSRSTGSVNASKPRHFRSDKQTTTMSMRQETSPYCARREDYHQPYYSDDAAYDSQSDEFDVSEEEMEDESDDEDSDSESSLDERQRLARLNADRNRSVTDTDHFNLSPVPTTSSAPHPDGTTAAQTHNTHNNLGLPTPPSSKSPPKKKWSLPKLFRRNPRPGRMLPPFSPRPTVIPRPALPLPSHPPLPVIRPVVSNLPFGEVLDPSQQQQLRRDLVANFPSKPSIYPIAPNAYQVAQLPYIWVFRVPPPSVSEADVWTAFDFENQGVIAANQDLMRKHLVPNDHSFCIQDSHIKDRRFPALIVLSQHRCYYPIDEHGSITFLEITCLPNQGSTELVYRTHNNNG